MCFGELVLVSYINLKFHTTRSEINLRSKGNTLQVCKQADQVVVTTKYVTIIVRNKKIKNLVYRRKNELELPSPSNNNSK